MHIRTTRVEAFSDGIIAIIITVMVFDLRFRDLTHGFSHRDVMNGMAVLWPKLLAYFFSFLVLGIMWINHHHMFHLIQVVDERLMWFNLNFLFWLSLIPLPTSMIGKNPFLPESAALYGTVLFLVSASLTMMRGYVMRHGLMHQESSRVNRAVDKMNRRVRIKNYTSLASYLFSIPLAYVSPLISFVLFLIPATIFFIPDGASVASDIQLPDREE